MHALYYDVLRERKSVDVGCVICECVSVLIVGLLSLKIIHLSPSGPLATDTSLLQYITHSHTIQFPHRTVEQCIYSAPVCLWCAKVLTCYTLRTV